MKLISRQDHFYQGFHACQAPVPPPASTHAPLHTATRSCSERVTDNNNWALPGGAIDIGESVAQAAIRETQEETGITPEITGLVGIYTDPRHVIHYTSNDEVRQEFSIVLAGLRVDGQPTPSNESSEVRWVSATDIEAYEMDRAMRKRIKRYLASENAPEII